MAENHASVEFNDTMKKDAYTFINGLIADAMYYFHDAIRMANESAVPPVSKEDFSNGLRIPSGRAAQYVIEQSLLDKPDFSEDPYSYMDLQSCSKYLLHGGRREDSPGHYRTDSFNFFRYFQITGYRTMESYVKAGRFFYPPRPYGDLLDKAIKLRNEFAHSSSKTVETLSLTKVREAMTLLKDLTADVQRKNVSFALIGKLKDYWQRKDKEYQKLFGPPPIDLEELGCELFFAEDGLTEEQKSALDEALEALHLPVENGSIYHVEKREQLLTFLRVAPSVARLLGTSPAEVTAEDAAQLMESGTSDRQEEWTAPAPLEKPLWQPPETAVCRTLRSAASGAALPVSSTVIDALLDGFVLLLDESIFLSEAGVRLLYQGIVPQMNKRGRRLPLDNSVSASLLRRFRASRPYTAMELAELDIEPAELEIMQADRLQEHQQLKGALKALRYVREHHCLEIVASPLEGAYSYENLRCTVEQNPSVRFLVLTMDRQLADEMGAVYSQNAVVAKPTQDDTLWIYRPSRALWQQMLSAAADTETARASLPAEAPAAETRRVPTGGVVMLRQPDGSQRRLRLGKTLGSGGEGTIYETSSADGAVAKIYRSKCLTEERRKKLERMAASDPQLPGLCWPQALLYNEQGEWVGYLMPRAEGEQLAQMVYFPSVLRELKWSRSDVVRIAVGVAEVFAAMHRRQILMGDVNPRNILVRQDGSVYFVDCDSYQFEDYICPVGVMSFTPPEIVKKNRDAGAENYRYLRTIENERYSVAVLLFGIVMLGKLPYESCNADQKDVEQAIIAGDFPYPYQGGEDDEDRAERRSTVRAPVGLWRQMWSNTTYRVKTAFYNTFTGAQRCSAEEWAAVMRDYLRLIEQGRSSNELFPTDYKETAGRNGEDATHMVHLTCEECGAAFNMDERTYQRRRENGDPILCGMHWEIRKNLNQRTKTQFCETCGQSFEMRVADWIKCSEQKRPILCKRCSTVEVLCSRCGKPYPEQREKVEELRAKGKPLYCPECLKLESVTVNCEECGRSVRMFRSRVDDLHRNGKQVLCRDCLTRLKSTW